MLIQSSEFVISNNDYFKCPKPEFPEFAFIGRSNVGKSSLINMLCGRSNLAKISTSPGKTRLINHFIINNSWYLVDLPGYGFAKIPLRERERIEKMMNWYLIDSNLELKKVLMVVDANVGPTKIDLQVLESLQAANQNIVVLANKIDKVKRGKYKMQLQHIQDEMGRAAIPCSARINVGINEVVNEILS